MSGETLADEQRAGNNEQNSFSLNFDRAWTPKDTDLLTESSIKTSATTFQMQINGDVITMTPQNACVGGRTNGKNPASVARRNARERRRIKNVNSAFDELREHVPHGERNKKKISKVDTLQSAIEYIKALEHLVRSRREGGSSQIDDYSIDKENIPEIISNDSPMSSTFTDSETEDVDSNTQVDQRDDEVDQQTQRSSEITDSMRKAFDIILNKTSLKRHSTLLGSIPSKQSRQDAPPYNYPPSRYEISDENPAENNFTKQEINEKYPESLATPESKEELHSIPSNVNQFISTLSQWQTNYFEDEASALVSSNPQTAASKLNSSPSNLTEASQYIARLHNDANEPKDHAIDLPLEHTVNLPDEYQHHLAATPAIQNEIWVNEAENEVNDWPSDATTTSQSEQWSNTSSSPDSSHVVENTDDVFGVQHNFVPMAIDQINPSIDFLPTDNEDFSDYATLFSPAIHSSLKQANTTFASQPAEPCWVLAQLN